MRGEQVKNNPENAGNSSNAWTEAMQDVPPFGSAEQQKEQKADTGESYYKDAQEMLNDKLFGSDWQPRLSEDLSGDPRMLDLPEYMADKYGLQESIDACDAKFQTAKVTTLDENSEIYNALNDAWLDMEEDAYRDEDKNKEAYAQLMRETLDGLVEHIKSFEDGDVQSLESVANHRIAQETKLYLETLKAGKLTDEYKERYAKRVTTLSEVRSALHYQKLNMRTNATPSTEQPAVEDTPDTSDTGEATTTETDTTDDETQMENVDTNKRFENSRVPLDTDFKRRMQELREQQKAEQEQRKEQDRINQASQAAIDAARQNRTEQTTQETSQQSPESEKAPMTYHIEPGSGRPIITITIGQEIPASWFESKTPGEKADSGFGISFVQPSLIEDILLKILSDEFNKLSADEREQYDYSAIATALKEEAKMTRRVPDVVATIKANKLELENEEEMEM